MKVNTILQDDMLMQEQRYTLLLGDFKEVGKQIANNSIDMIFTDPPYLKNNIEARIYDDLGCFANRVLKVGGQLLTWVNTHYIPEITNQLTNHLNFIWLFYIRQAHFNAKIRGWRIFVKGKPLLWYIKGKYKKRQFIRDCIQSKSYDGKTFHDWQQSEYEIAYYISKMTDVDEIICDPFMGSGSIGVVTIQQGRKFVGIEKEENTFKIAEKRIQEHRNHNITDF